MGRSHSKIKFPNNPLEKIEYNLKRKQKELEKRKKRHEKVEKQLKKGKKFKHMTGEETPTKRHDLRISDYDTIATNRLRNQLDIDFGAFVLNQLILSVQFYGNYEREKSDAIERNFRRESDMNKNLEKHSIILPNVLDDMVEHRLRFRPKHGCYKNEPSALQVQTMFVVHENIEILKPDDTNYASISPTCKFVLDTQNLKSENWKGYVRLKLWEIGKKKTIVKPEKRRKRRIKIANGRTNKQDIETTTTDDDDSSDDLYSGTRHMNGDGEHTRSSSSTVTNHSSSEYDYAYIANLNTHRPLSQLTTTNYESSEASSSSVPGFCISGLPTYLDYNSSDTEDREYPNYSTDKTKYLNSKAFLCYFAKQLKDSLAWDLGISDKELEIATWRGASIYTTSYEFIPAIFCPWPTCAFEWQRRERPVHENPITGQQFQWPNQSMVHRIVSFGCHVIPLGYAPKRGKNPFRELEWKIVFPKAERYLESCLTSTQTKIFMISKALVKTFIEPQQKNDTYMFSFDHLRTHLFWQCEKNYGAWPDEYLGEVLIRFLTSFLHSISCKRLRDYFLPDRNLFENIPEKAKADLHQIISQIVQNPVMHIMMAYRNVHFIQNFCPKLHYKELYSVIVVDNPVTVINKSTRTVRTNKVLENIIRSEILSDDSDDNDDSEDAAILDGLIGYSQKKEKFDESKRRRTKKLKRKERAKLRKKLETEKAKRHSTDSIDLHFMVPGSLEKIKRSQMKPQVRKTLDELRRSFIIEQFVNLFISSAKNSYSHQSLNQSTIYLSQASRLCRLLEEFSKHDTVKKHTESIEKIRDLVRTALKNETESGPELPRRISLEPIKSFHQNFSKFRNGKIDPYTNIDIVTVKQEKLKDETAPRKTINARKSVQFTETSFIEPRQFFATSAQIHSAPPADQSKTKLKLNGIMKQSSSEDSQPSSHHQFRTVNPSKTELKIATFGTSSDDEFYGDSTEL